MIKLMIMTVERIKLEPDWLAASFSFPLLEQTAFFPDGQTLLKNQFIFFTKGDVHTPPDEATEGIDEEVDGVKGKSASRRY